jgi:hypothetical protein
MSRFRGAGKGTGPSSIELPGARRTMRIFGLRNRSLSPLAELFIDSMRALAKPMAKGK